MLQFQVAITLLAFIAASTFVLSKSGAAIVSYHIVLAIGIVPLILGAMVHFLPVLSRSKNPGKFIRLLPVIALFGGFLVTSNFAYPQALSAGRYVSATTIIIAVSILGSWAYRLKVNAIGKPHPCLDWYLAAMLCIFIAVGCIIMGYFIPEQRSALRMLHIHFNTLGFIGITALGTLQVLLPTVTQRSDPEVAARMRKHLKCVVAGIVITACGSAWHRNFAWIGLILLAIPLFDILKTWLKLYSNVIFKVHGAVPLLVAALCGYSITLIIGLTHAYHQQSFSPVATFIIAFLMPLVTGAVSYLLPLWMRPGQQTPWHQAARKRLGFGGGIRALLLLTGGVMAGFGYEIGWYLAVFTTGIFVVQTFSLFLQHTKIPE